jgi:hypothetical protein
MEREHMGLRRRWNIIINMILKDTGIEGVNWIQLPRDRD